MSDSPSTETGATHTALEDYCSLCYENGEPMRYAAHKIGEESTAYRKITGHNLTNYLCCEHFTAVMGPFTDCPTAPEVEVRDQITTHVWRAMKSAIDEFVAFDEGDDGDDGEDVLDDALTPYMQEAVDALTRLIDDRVREAYQSGWADHIEVVANGLGQRESRS